MWRFGDNMHGKPATLRVFVAIIGKMWGAGSEENEVLRFLGKLFLLEPAQVREKCLWAEMYYIELCFLFSDSCQCQFSNSLVSGYSRFSPELKESKVASTDAGN